RRIFCHSNSSTDYLCQTACCKATRLMMENTMITPPTRFQSAWRQRWMITLMLVLLPALTFAWWGHTDYPDTFPSLVEDLDRQAWVNGAETLFPDRYQQFHTQMLELRAQWRTEANHWWTTGD